jgi:ribosomal-protein-alanine N-acetyltransferase
MGPRHAAHLVRLTINPGMQGYGIGSALLAHALRSYRQQGIRQVTLNTQTDNKAAQRLYAKFGFQPQGSIYNIWTKPLVQSS